MKLPFQRWASVKSGRWRWSGKNWRSARPYAKPSAGFSAGEIEKQYKRLQLVEDGFRVLKSTLDIRPMFHWTPERIKAHVFICFIALQLTVFFELRLRVMQLSFERAVEKRSQLHVVTWRSGNRKLRALTSATPDQLEIFGALKVSKPVINSFVVSDF